MVEYEVISGRGTVSERDANDLWEQAAIMTSGARNRGKPV